MLASSLSPTTFHRAQSRPRLVCIDLQREYVVPGRPLYEAGSAPVATICQRVLEYARAQNWRVIHTQQCDDKGLFERSGYFGAPIEGLRPRISEPVFVRRGLSAFSNPDFSAEMRKAVGEEVFVIGFSLNHACLATALAGFDLGLTMTLVQDAMGIAPRPDATSARVCAAAKMTLAPYVRFASSEEFVARAAVPAEEAVFV